MKKLLGISLVAALAVAPMMGAMADPYTPTGHNASEYALTDGTSDTATESGISETGNNVPVAAAGKYFAGKAVTADDAATVATGAYVKGAYNAAISAINKVAEDMGDGFATKEGVVNTIESSTVDVIDTVSLAPITAYADWENDANTVNLAPTVNTTRTYAPVVVTATKSSGSQTYDVKYHESKVSVANDLTTSPNTYVAPEEPQNQGD